MNKSAILILDHIQINRKIKRIAYQIYENNVNEKKIILAGIANNGFELAKKLKTSIEIKSRLNHGSSFGIVLPADHD